MLYNVSFFWSDVCVHLLFYCQGYFCIRYQQHCSIIFDNWYFSPFFSGIHCWFFILILLWNCAKANEHFNSIISKNQKHWKVRAECKWNLFYVKEFSKLKSRARLFSWIGCCCICFISTFFRIQKRTISRFVFLIFTASLFRQLIPTIELPPNYSRANEM